MRTVLAGYFPVIHAGYVALVRRESFDAVMVLSDDLVGRFDWKRKDIRAVTSAEAVALLRALLPSSTAVEEGGLRELRDAAMSGRLVMPDDEVTRAVCADAGISEEVEPVSAFLRWDSSKLAKKRTVSVPTVTRTDIPSALAWDEAWSEAAKSSDWWRQVGAVAVSGGQVLALAHNRHVPHELMPYAFGDPRMFAKRGVAIEISTALHAEAAVVAEAAKRGLALDGADLYVTTFPCPPCAKLIAASGFRRLYFQDGYGMLDAETVLRSAGVELFQVAG
jgi:dCMP deaminase